MPEFLNEDKKPLHKCNLVELATIQDTPARLLDYYVDDCWCPLLEHGSLGTDELILRTKPKQEAVKGKLLRSRLGLRNDVEVLEILVKRSDLDRALADKKVEW